MNYVEVGGGKKKNKNEEATKWMSLGKQAQHGSNGSVCLVFSFSVHDKIKLVRRLRFPFLQLESIRTAWRNILECISNSVLLLY